MPVTESLRIEALIDLAVLDTPPDLALDDMVDFARTRFHVPIALVSLVDTGRQWFKARVGLDVCETARDISFCTHAVAEDDILVVPDALEDPRFRDNPLVSGGPRIRFYAGAPLRYKRQPIGTFCIIDTAPRTSFTPEDRADLVTLANAAVAEMEMERARRFYRD